MGSSDELSENEVAEIDVLRNLVEVYECLPVLWDPCNRHYNDKVKRNEALDILLQIFVKIKPQAKREDVTKKINTLRNYYTRHKRKIAESQKSATSEDKVYKPKSWIFRALRFLDNIKTPTVFNLQQAKQANGESNVETTVHSPPVVICKRSNARFTLKPALKKIRLTPESNARLDKPKLIRPNINPAEQNNLPNKAAIYLQRSPVQQPEIPAICKVWSEKLKKLDEHQRVFAEKAINDILFEATLGTLHRNSVRINEELNQNIQFNANEPQSTLTSSTVHLEETNYITKEEEEMDPLTMTLIDVKDEHSYF